MNVNPGELRYSIDILERRMVQDAEGYWQETMPVVLTCWARFRRRSGYELERNDADYKKICVRFLIRTPAAALSRKMLVRYAGDLYEITYVNDYDDRGEYTELTCVLLDTGG